jgi:guanylate kinase
VPNQPVEDRRRPLGAAAGRAGRALQPPRVGTAASRPVFVVPARPGLARERSSRAARTRSRPRGRGVRDDPPQRPGEVDGLDYWFLERREFTRRVEDDASSSGSIRLGTPVRDAELRDRPHCRDGRRLRARARARGRAEGSARRPGSITIFIAADVDELERRLRERATESTGEIGERNRAGTRAARARARVSLHGAKRRPRAGDERTCGSRRV